MRIRTKWEVQKALKHWMIKNMTTNFQVLYFSENYFYSQGHKFKIYLQLNNLLLSRIDWNKSLVFTCVSNFTLEHPHICTQFLSSTEDLDTASTRQPQVLKTVKYRRNRKIYFENLSGYSTSNVKQLYRNSFLVINFFRKVSFNIKDCQKWIQIENLKPFEAIILNFVIFC